MLFYIHDYNVMPKARPYTIIFESSIMSEENNLNFIFFPVDAKRTEEEEARQRTARNMIATKKKVEIEQAIKRKKVQLEKAKELKQQLNTQSSVSHKLLGSLTEMVQMKEKSNESSIEIFVKFESRLKAEVSETRIKMQQEEARLVTTKIQYKEALGTLKKAELELHAVEEMELYALGEKETETCIGGEEKDNKDNTIEGNEREPYVSGLNDCPKCGTNLYELILDTF
jgi:hypothetical protein